MDKLRDGYIRGWQSVTNGDDLAPVLVPADTIYAMATEIITRRDADAVPSRTEGQKLEFRNLLDALEDAAIESAVAPYLNSREAASAEVALLKKLLEMLYGR